VMLWLAKMKPGDFVLLLPPAALLAASLVIVHFLDSSLAVTFPVAAIVGVVSFVLGYVFSDDWRAITLAQVNRGRVFLAGLTGYGLAGPAARRAALRRFFRSRGHHASLRSSPAEPSGTWRCRCEPLGRSAAADRRRSSRGCLAATAW
jgi:hypothetical protein